MLCSFFLSYIHGYIQHSFIFSLLGKKRAHGASVASMYPWCVLLPANIILCSFLLHGYPAQFRFEERPEDGPFILRNRVLPASGPTYVDTIRNSMSRIVFEVSNIIIGLCRISGKFLSGMTVPMDAECMKNAFYSPNKIRVETHKAFVIWWSLYLSMLKLEKEG